MVSKALVRIFAELVKSGRRTLEEIVDEEVRAAVAAAVEGGVQQ